MNKLIMTEPTDMQDFIKKAVHPAEGRCSSLSSVHKRER